MLNLKDSVIDKGVGSNHSLADLVVVHLQVDTPIFSYKPIGGWSIGSLLIVANIEP